MIIKSNRQCIRELIKVLSRPHNDLIWTFYIRDTYWSGLRLNEGGYELYLIWPIPEHQREDYGGAEEVENILDGLELDPDEEEELKGVLEGFLLD